MATCEGDISTPPDRNASPRLAVPIPQQVVRDSVVLDLSAHFTDPDGDALSFTAMSSNTAVVRAELAGAAATLIAVVKGSATVTVTATDPDGATATHGFAVTVPNRAPRVVVAIPDAEALTGDQVTIRVAGYFTEPDQDSLTFGAETTEVGVATVSVTGDEVTVGAISPGVATITVTATDPEGLVAAQDFHLTVPNRAPRATDPLPDIELEVGEEVETRMSGHFTDPDGEELTFAASSSREAVTEVGVSGADLTVGATAKGTATITVTATDRDRYRRLGGHTELASNGSEPCAPRHRHASRHRVGGGRRSVSENVASLRRPRRGRAHLQSRIVARRRGGGGSFRG